MKRYLVWIYTKSGIKKRYETNTNQIIDQKTNNFQGHCLKSGINFCIPIHCVEVYEWQEILDE